MRICPECKEEVEFFGGNNPHYVPSVGHYAGPDEAIEPYYTCTTKEQKEERARARYRHRAAQGWY